jgi:Ca-activated chloride channel family protein
LLPKGGNVQFEHPHLLWFLLFLVPASIAFFWWAQRAKARLVAQFVAARLVSNLTVGVSASRQKVRIALIVAAAVLLIIALARPQIGFSYEEARSRGLDIVVAIDTSKSMLASDVAPNRLRRAQLAAMDLKRLARTDRLALVAFAGSAFLQCPLTLDDEAFRQSIEALDVNIIPQGGSAVSEAIASAKSAFKEGNDNHKVLVLFTDGEDNEGSALEAAKSAGKDGMRIFTIGVGTPNGELLRVTDTQGRTEFIKDTDGNAVKSRLNESLLQSIAQPEPGDLLEDALDARFGEQVERRGADTEAIAAALDLVLGFFARGVEDRPDLPREMRGGLQQQCRLADARLTAEQNERAWHDPAAQHAIELVDAGRQPHRVGELDLRIQRRPAAGTELGVAVARGRGRRRLGRALLDQRVPRAAVAALAHPLGGLGTAFLADENDFVLHGQAQGLRPRGQGLSQA